MFRHALLLAILLSLPAGAAPSIRWEPFALPAGGGDLHAELGRLTVPLDRRHPEEGTADLAFVRVRAGETGLNPPIVYLAGGPGNSGTGVARNPWAMPTLQRLARIGDVILLDQRGAGLSSPRPVCAAEGETDPRRRFLPAAEALERYTARARACVAEWAAKGVDATDFNNVESAADVDDLRRALGAEKISLVAFSYGTYLAIELIRDYGGSVHRAALLATAGPDHMRKLPSMLDTQLGKLSLLAAADPAIGGDVPDMTQLLRRVLANLDREPITVTVLDRARKEEVRVPIRGDALRSFLVADIGDGSDFPYFPALLLTLERGDPSILEWFAEKRYNQGGGVNLMMLGMRCSAGASALRDERIRREAEASVFGNAVNFPFPAVCAVFPPFPGGDASRTSVVANVPVLFVSGTLDSNTPPYQAEEVRWGMPYASHLIVANAGHEDLEPSEMVQAAVADYLAGKDVSDRRIALPLPRFRSVDEARRERRREPLSR